MRRLVLCALVIVSVGVITEAQDSGSGTNLAAQIPAPVSVGDKIREPASRAADSALSSGSAITQHHVNNRGRQFTICLESSWSSSLLKPCRLEPLGVRLFDTRPRLPKPTVTEPVTDDKSFNWSSAIQQSLIFLGLQHGYAMTQPKTRQDLKGPFFKDYLRSVKSLHGWGDGGKFFTNYIAHPLEGSLVGFIQVQNDPKGVGLRFGESNAYWRSRLKALAWSAAWSTQFELGPISQASIGNVGLHGKQTYVDLVVTPIAGIGLLVVEDALDTHLVRRIELNMKSLYVTIASRMLLNPTRSIANILRFKKPWYRDNGLR